MMHPFDTMRLLHASAVRTGVVPRSIIEAGRFERWLHALETMMLGPLARRR